MKKFPGFLTMIAAMAIAVTFASAPIYAQSSGVQSLRGENSIPETPEVNDVKKQNTSGRFTKAYRQQPPMIPHRMEKYQINLKVNQCLRCHDWPYNVQEGAPKVSETHYTNRDGVALDRVTKSRWFCTQCHVPQVQARPLVKNEFKPSHDVDGK